MKKQAKARRKGPVAVPREIRVTVVRKKSPFEKYRGIGRPGMGKGRKGIHKWLRGMRGE
jgi:hypothetical protein